MSLDFNDSLASSAVNATSSDIDIKMVHKEESMAIYYVGMMVSLPLLVLGSVGNMLIILVMRRKSFHKSSASVYLPLMAVADTSFLVIGIFHEWLEWFDVELDPWACKIHRFFFYSTGDLAIWIIVAFTFDRFIAVCFPLKKRFFCEPRRAAVTILVIGILCAIKNFHVFWTRGVEYDANDQIVKYCGFAPPYVNFELFIRPWIAFAVIMVTPFCSIIVFNIMIVVSLLRSRRMRASATSTGGGNDGRAFIQTTAMCLSVSFAFLICIAPSILILIGKPYWKRTGGNAGYTIAKVINNQLVYLNHSINFLLYCLTGERFRTELMTLFGKTQPRRSQTMNTLQTGGDDTGPCSPQPNAMGDKKPPLFEEQEIE